MKTKINLSAHNQEVFYKYIYPLHAKEFLFGNDYEKFAEQVEQDFILNPTQWENILFEWEYKENILKD